VQQHEPLQVHADDRPSDHGPAIHRPLDPEIRVQGPMRGDAERDKRVSPENEPDDEREVAVAPAAAVVRAFRIVPAGHNARLAQRTSVALVALRPQALGADEAGERSRAVAPHARLAVQAGRGVADCVDGADRAVAAEDRGLADRACVARDRASGSRH